ncbi:MAG: hypothetical protein ACLTQF_04240 [Lachnospira sp.]
MSNELSNKTVTYLLGEISGMLENMQNSLRTEIAETRDSLQSSLRAEIAETRDSLQNSLRAEIAETRDSLQSSLRTEIAETRDSLQSQLTQINLTLEQNVVPRLNTIESCYVSTYERYSQGINQLESIQSDILVMKDVIMKHSTQLAKIS